MGNRNESEAPRRSEFFFVAGGGDAAGEGNFLVATSIDNHFRSPILSGMNRIEPASLDAVDDGNIRCRVDAGGEGPQHLLLIVDIDVRIDEERDLRIDVKRSSGPGGQSVNTTDSAVRITHLPTGLVVEIQDEKSQHKNKAKALAVLRSRLYELELEKQRAADSATRRSMVGGGERAEKIRTYNFPQNRVTDHRIHKDLFGLPAFLEGDLDEMIDALVTSDQADRLAELGADGSVAS